jgi:hypothetical protein
VARFHDGREGLLRPVQRLVEQLEVDAPESLINETRAYGLVAAAGELLAAGRGFFTGLRRKQNGAESSSSDSGFGRGGSGWERGETTTLSGE